MKNKLIKVFTYLSILWISYIFLSSLPYKFTNHSETRYIFSIIGEWMEISLGESIGKFFTDFGAYGIGSLELIVSIILLIPFFYYILKIFGLLKNKEIPEYLFAIGGIGASIIMTGAVFFHLFTPLGTEVNNDGGSLFRAAISILILGIILFILYFQTLKKKCTKN